MSFTNDEGEEETDDLTYNRQDFWTTTSNKQRLPDQHSSHAEEEAATLRASGRFHRALQPDKPPQA